MPADEYTSAVGGGLKLKGGISKKPKKSKKKSKAETTDINDAKDGTVTTREKEAAEKELQEEMALAEEEDTIDDDGESGRGKTEAERKFDEMRRKRLDERLKKDGAKTHKQRVEELNRYLSTLSEHHDMPRIGPG